MDLLTAERRLQAAQRAADVDALDDGRTGTTRIVAAVAAVQDGTQDGTEVSARLRYTRLRVRDDGQWRVLAATIVPV